MIPANPRILLRRYDFYACSGSNSDWILGAFTRRRHNIAIVPPGYESPLTVTTLANAGALTLVPSISG
jgi:hypothetical protein